MKKLTIADIAKELGVSKTLVSMVLNGKAEQHNINKDTEKRVLDYAHKHNYKVNKLAQGLRTGKSRIIGLIVADIANEFYSNIAKEIEICASKNNYQVIICCSNEDSKKELEQIQILREHQVDGLILSPTQKNKNVIKEMLKDNFPFVLIDRYFHDVYTNVVAVDNRNGAYKLTEHVLRSGYEKCGVLSVSRHLIVMEERIKGIIDAFYESRLIFDDSFVKEIKTSESEFFNKVEKAVLKTVSNGATCFIALNNELAKGFILAKQNNPSKLKDVTLFCYDDVVINMLSNPQITAIRQPIDKICTNAIKLLLSNIENGYDPQKIILETDLVVRNGGK